MQDILSSDLKNEAAVIVDYFFTFKRAIICKNLEYSTHFVNAFQRTQKAETKYAALF